MSVHLTHFKHFVIKICVNLIHFRVKLNEVLKINEKLRKKEEDLKKYTVDVITKYVDAQSTQLALSATTETIHHIQDATEKLMQVK